MSKRTVIESSKNKRDWQPKLIRLTNDEYFEYARELEDHHALFYAIWQIGKPWFTEIIPTAAVAFDKEGHDCVQFVFNPHFWERLTLYERLFVICHEALHVILNHGFRALNAEDR